MMAGTVINLRLHFKSIANNSLSFDPPAHLQGKLTVKGTLCVQGYF